MEPGCRSSDDWIEGEGWMGQLLPIRDELARGDYRSLYIGWLSSIAGECWRTKRMRKTMNSDDLEEEDDEANA